MSETRSLLARTMGTRIAVLPVQAIAAAAAVYLTIRSIGAEAYATVGLLVGLQALFGFLNLGSSASVANAAGESLVHGTARLFGVLVTATRFTALAGGITLLLSGVVALLGLWPTLLGSGDPDLLTWGALVASAGLVLLAPLMQGVGVLMATGHTVAATIATGATSLVTLCFVGIAAVLNAPPIVFVACPFVGQLIVASATVIGAARAVDIGLGALGESITDRAYRGTSIGHEARPALIIWILLPIAYQTDRLMISHLSTTKQLASYNLTAQFYLACFSIVAAGSAALWGFYARARAESTLPTRAQFVRLSVGFGLIGAGLAACLALGMPRLAEILSRGEVAVSRSLALGFGALLILQAFHQPSAMIQTDVSGLRFNAAAVMAMTVLNVILGIILTPPLGALGPVLASVLALSGALALPSFCRAFFLLRVRNG